MRKFTSMFWTLMLLIIGAATLATAGDKAWFDIENCAMCKPMMKYSGLLENSTWEHHDISNGIVTVTTVRDGHLGDYRKAGAEMAEVGKEMEQGKKFHLCPMCTALSGIFPKGVKSEYVTTEHGDVWILTADNPDVVAELQSWAHKTNEEMAKIMAASEQAK